MEEGSIMDKNHIFDIKIRFLNRKNDLGIKKEFSKILRREKSARGN